MSAPTLAIPLLVPRPKALVAVGYTCRVSENTEEAALMLAVLSRTQNRLHFTQYKQQSAL